MKKRTKEQDVPRQGCYIAKRKELYIPVEKTEEERSERGEKAQGGKKAMSVPPRPPLLAPPLPVSYRLKGAYP